MLTLYTVTPREPGRRILVLESWKNKSRRSVQVAAFTAAEAINDVFELQVEAIDWHFGREGLSRREEREMERLTKRIVPRSRLRAVRATRRSR